MYGHIENKLKNDTVPPKHSPVVGRTQAEAKTCVLGLADVCCD